MKRVVSGFGESNRRKEREKVFSFLGFGLLVLFNTTDCGVLDDVFAPCCFKTNCFDFVI